MDWLIFFIVVVWLLIISWFDLRTGEIPHSLWVILPLIAAGAFRAWQGQWQLVLLSAVVSLVSERQRISHWFHLEEASRMITWLPLLMLITFWGAQVAPIPAFAIIAFWIAWELGWWGGADAVSAIALTLVWPGTDFLIAFLGCHVMITLGLAVSSLWKDHKLSPHRLPGLPIMLWAVLLLKILQIIHFAQVFQ